MIRIKSNKYCCTIILIHFSLHRKKRSAHCNSIWWGERSVRRTNGIAWNSQLKIFFFIRKFWLFFLIGRKSCSFRRFCFFIQKHILSIFLRRANGKKSIHFVSSPWNSQIFHIKNTFPQNETEEMKWSEAGLTIILRKRQSSLLNNLIDLQSTNLLITIDSGAGGNFYENRSEINSILKFQASGEVKGGNLKPGTLLQNLC